MCCGCCPSPPSDGAVRCGAPPSFSRRSCCSPWSRSRATSSPTGVIAIPATRRPASAMQSRSAATSSDIQRSRARRLTAVGAAAFAAASIALVAAKGLILSRDWLFAWLLVGLLAVSLADPKRWVRGVVVDWLPLMAVLLCYDLSRPVREWIGTSPHIFPQLDADRWLFGGDVPTVT